MSDSTETTTYGGREILFEESLSIKDEAGASSYIKWAGYLLVVMIIFSLVGSVLFVVLTVVGFVFLAGGIDVALAFLEGVLAERPLPAVLATVFVLGTAGFFLFVILGFVWGWQTGFDQQVHVRVTDAVITVERTGGGLWRRHWQASGVEIPFDVITAVEYLDSEKSSSRIELGDVGSKKFFAGRSKKWIRIDRADDLAVYIGSDRPLYLAETIAERAPGVDNAQPY